MTNMVCMSDPAHQSTDKLSCTVCGSDMVMPNSASSSDGVEKEHCPKCSTERDGLEPICGGCRYDFEVAPAGSIAGHSSGSAGGANVAPGGEAVALTPGDVASDIVSGDELNAGWRRPDVIAGLADVRWSPGADAGNTGDAIAQGAGGVAGNGDAVAQSAVDVAGNGDVAGQSGGGNAATGDTVVPAGGPAEYFIEVVQRVRVFAGDNLVGRRTSSIEQQVPLGDAHVSGRHCLIHFDGAGFTVVDLQSTNGTQLNGNALTPHQVAVLKEGDELSVGEGTVLKIVSVKSTR